MSDPDQGWKPSGRPQSTMAQAFSSALDTAFSLDSDVDQLANKINFKKSQMIMQTRELEILQAKIREAESRLQARESTVVEEGSSSAPEPKTEDQENQNGSTDSNYSTESSPNRTDHQEYPVDDHAHSQQVENNS